jgi:hypothetical protein
MYVRMYVCVGPHIYLNLMLIESFLSYQNFIIHLSPSLFLSLSVGLYMYVCI